MQTSNAYQHIIIIIPSWLIDLLELFDWCSSMSVLILHCHGLKHCHGHDLNPPSLEYNVTELVVQISYQYMDN